MSFLLAAFLVWLKVTQVHQLEFYHHQETKHIKPALESDSFMKTSKYKQPLILFNSFLQSVFHALLEKHFQNPQVEFLHESYQFKDGGAVALDWINSFPNENDKKPILIISPGFTGDRTSAYMYGMYNKGLQDGYYPVCLSFEGSTIRPLTHPRLFKGWSGQDIQEPLEYLFKKYCIDQNNQRKRQVFFMAVSFSGTILTHYLGAEGDKHKIITAAASVCTQQRQWISNITLDKSYFGQTKKFFGVFLRDIFANNVGVLRDLFKKEHDLDLDAYVKDKKGVDDYILLIAKMNNFHDLDDYYKRVSMIHSIPKVRVPIFYIYSKDDPVIGHDHIDFKACQNNPYILLGITNKGAHVCHVESIFKPSMWFAKPAIEFLNSYRVDF
ncbi:alpha beta hydrolase domain containing protein [Stylonychia lemnae]|uniref:Alpha beta hydrolase domain containing protein n=1 Tax=Stylonychia lemnae TaxID=5949 RepID=A0A078A729_STYLE|nr:alpha beta hydrolase domain containing protein [Stylonychia lemnae]|eukprot:CDW78044.1 alpha beta hydrolase domain containing protein [Stylonychia lemnae]